MLIGPGDLANCAAEEKWHNAMQALSSDNSPQKGSCNAAVHCKRVKMLCMACISGVGVLRTQHEEGAGRWWHSSESAHKRLRGSEQSTTP